MALNPHQKNKVDINALSEEEQKLFRLYGKLPNKKDLFSKKLQERKYFDSGDYALSKAGKSDAGSLGGGLGREHPTYVFAKKVVLLACRQLLTILRSPQT